MRKTGKQLLFNEKSDVGDITNHENISTEPSSHFAQEPPHLETRHRCNEKEDNNQIFFKKIQSEIEILRDNLLNSNIVDIVTTPVHTPQQAFLQEVCLEQQKAKYWIQECKKPFFSPFQLLIYFL